VSDRSEEQDEVIRKASADKADDKTMPSPTVEQRNSPEFEAIWNLIKSWDINVPEYYEGYCGANGSHVALILNELDKVKEK
jgi:hypothetical protein